MKELAVLAEFVLLEFVNACDELLHGERGSIVCDAGGWSFRGLPRWLINRYSAKHIFGRPLNSCTLRCFVSLVHEETVL